MANNKNVALTGGYAVGEAMRQINPDVVAVYPITPQTPIVEYFSKQVADGKAETEIIPVESEHSAMSACIGAAAAGARTITASSSQGIMYMLELLPIASAMRLPILMAVANRAISGPLNIHGDHSDAMAMREYGWVQIFSENAQEAYDNTFLGMKLAERALLPVAVNLDGFYTSHSVENLDLLDSRMVKKFINDYKPSQSLLDFSNPVTMGSLVLPNAYFEFRLQVAKAMTAAYDHFNKVAKEFGRLSGRKYESIESYRIKDATQVIVAMGSSAGTIKDVVDQLRNRGRKVGLIKIRLFRPFPYQDVKKALRGKKEVIVLDRNLAVGTTSVLAGEVQQATGRPVQSLVYGLGGRDLFAKQVEKIFDNHGKGSYIL